MLAKSWDSNPGWDDAAALATLLVRSGDEREGDDSSCSWRPKRKGRYGLRGLGVGFAISPPGGGLWTAGCSFNENLPPASTSAI